MCNPIFGITNCSITYMQTFSVFRHISSPSLLIGSGTGRTISLFIHSLLIRKRCIKVTIVTLIVAAFLRPLSKLLGLNAPVLNLLNEFQQRCVVLRLHTKEIGVRNFS